MGSGSARRLVDDLPVAEPDVIGSARRSDLRLWHQKDSVATTCLSVSSRLGQPNPAVDDTITIEPPGFSRSNIDSVRWRIPRKFTLKTRSAGAVPGMHAT